MIMKNLQVNLQSRIPIDSLQILRGYFDGQNPRKYGSTEISQAAGVATVTVRNLLTLFDRRPDLLKLVFSDQLSLYRATKLMKAEPEKWLIRAKTRL